MNTGTKSESNQENETETGPLSCFDLARDLAGTVKGLPQDLAQNPKYMEEFGK